MTDGPIRRHFVLHSLSAAVVFLPLLGASATTVRAIDQSSPKALLRTFLASGGDVAEVDIRAMLHAGNAMEQQMLEAVVKIELAKDRLRDAEQAKFGSVTTMPVIPSPLIDPSAVDELDALDEKINGDHATVSAAGKSMEFVRIDGKWKLPIASLVGPVDPATGETLNASTRAQIAVIDAVIEEVKAGRLASEEAVSQELSKRLADRLVEARNVATQSQSPSTAPVSRPARGT